MRAFVSRLVVVTLGAASLGVVAAGQAASADPTCPPDITGTTIHANVNVPSGICNISDSTVFGNVTVQPGASLNMHGSKIIGSITANNPQAIAIGSHGSTPSSISGSVTVLGVTGTLVGVDYICDGTTIGGSVSIQQSGAGAPWEIGTGSCTSGGNTIKGSVSLGSNAARVNFDNNTVKGSVSAQKNTGDGEIKSNPIGGSLTVVGNCPPWTVSGNSVTGKTTIHQTGCP